MLLVVLELSIGHRWDFKHTELKLFYYATVIKGGNSTR